MSAPSPGTAELFSHVPDTMYFGGFPGEHDFIDVTNDDFNGCIDGVILSSIAVDLSKSKEILGTAPGCPIKVCEVDCFVVAGRAGHESMQTENIMFPFEQVMMIIL